MVVGETEISSKRRSFRSHTTHKLAKLWGSPQQRTPMLRRSQTITKSTSKPSIYTTKTISVTFTHTGDRFWRCLHVVHRRVRETERRIFETSQIRECEALTNQTNTINGIRGRRWHRNWGKRTSKRRYRGEREIARKFHITGRIRRSLTWGPDPATRIESNPLHSKPRPMTPPRPNRLNPN